MARRLLTNTCYGNWLPGDERGVVGQVWEHRPDDRPKPRNRHNVLATPYDKNIAGLVQAVHASKVLVPQIWGQGGPMTLTKLIPNGSHVKEGDLIAVFDSTQQFDLARDAKAKYEDLGHQVEQKIAQNRSDAEKRTQDLRQAEADL